MQKWLSLPGEEVRVGVLAVLVLPKVLGRPEILGQGNPGLLDHSPEFNGVEGGSTSRWEVRDLHQLQGEALVLWVKDRRNLEKEDLEAGNKGVQGTLQHVNITTGELSQAIATFEFFGFYHSQLEGWITFYYWSWSWSSWPACSSEKSSVSILTRQSRISDVGKTREWVSISSIISRAACANNNSCIEFVCYMSWFQWNCKTQPCP